MYENEKRKGVLAVSEKKNFEQDCTVMFAPHAMIVAKKWPNIFECGRK